MSLWTRITSLFRETRDDDTRFREDDGNAGKDAGEDRARPTETGEYAQVRPVKLSPYGPDSFQGEALLRDLPKDRRIEGLDDIPSEGSTLLRRLTEAAYPPLPRSFPALTVSQTLDLYGAYVHRTAEELPLKTADFNALALPVIRKAICYMHLLPAAKDYHHKGMGGLLAHSFEVGILAARAATDHVFDRSETPKLLYHNRPRWIFAAWLAGFLHDAGKPVTDITVTSGGEVWYPYTESLVDWLQMNNRDGYFVSWKSGRVHNEHRPAVLSILPRIVSTDLIDWFRAYGSERIWKSCELAVSGVGGPEDLSLIANLVMRADEESTERDRKSRENLDERKLMVEAQPARRLLTAVKTLVTDGTWTVNKPGSRLWVTNFGVFIVWNDVTAEEIWRCAVNQLGFRDLPRRAQNMVAVLDAAKCIRPAPESVSSVQDRYWPVQVSVLPTTAFRCIALVQADLIFEDGLTPPPAVPAKVVGLASTPEGDSAWKDFVAAQSRAEEEKRIAAENARGTKASDANDAAGPAKPAKSGKRDIPFVTDLGTVEGEPGMSVDFATAEATVSQTAEPAGESKEKETKKASSPVDAMMPSDEDDGVPPYVLPGGLNGDPGYDDAEAEMWLSDQDGEDDAYGIDAPYSYSSDSSGYAFHEDFDGDFEELDGRVRGVREIVDATEEKPEKAPGEGKPAVPVEPVPSEPVRTEESDAASLASSGPVLPSHHSPKMPEEGFDVSMHRGSAKPTPDFAVPSTGAPAIRESTHGSMTAKIVEEAAQRMRDEEEKFGDFAYGFGKAGTLRSEVSVLMPSDENDEDAEEAEIHEIRRVHQAHQDHHQNEPGEPKGPKPVFPTAAPSAVHVEQEDGKNAKFDSVISVNSVNTSINSVNAVDNGRTGDGRGNREAPGAFSLSDLYPSAPNKDVPAPAIPAETTVVNNEIGGGEEKVPGTESDEEPGKNTGFVAPAVPVEHGEPAAVPAGAGKVGIQTEIQTGTGVDRSGHKADNGRKTQVEIASLFPSDTEADESLEIVKNDRYEITENIKKSPGNSINAGADAKTAGDSVSLSMRNNGRENRLDHAGEQADQADQEATIPFPVVPVHAEHNGLNGIAGTRYQDSSFSSPSSPSSPSGPSGTPGTPGTPGTSDSRNNESEHPVHHSDFERTDEKTEARSNSPFRSNTGVSDQDTEAVKPRDFPPDNPNHCRDDRVNGVNEELCGLSTSVIDAEKTADSVCLFRSDNEPHREEDNVEITAVGDGGTSGTSVNDAENNSDSVCLFRLDNEPVHDAENFETTTPDSVCLFRSNTASTQPDDETGFSDSSSVEVIDAVDVVDAFDEVEMVEVEDPDAAAEACGSVPDEPDLASLDGIRLSNPADKTEGTAADQNPEEGVNGLLPGEAGAVEPEVPVEAEALSEDHSDESSHGSSHEPPEAETNWARIYGDDALLDPEESEAASRMFTERLKLAQRSGSSAGPAGNFAQPAVPVSIPVRLPLKPIDGLAVHHEQGAAEGKEYAYKDFDADGNEIRNAVDRSDDQAANQVNPVNRHAADASRESSVHAEQGDPEGAGSYGRSSDALFDGNGTDVPAANSVNSVNSVNTEDFDFADEYAETWNAAGAAESNSKPKTVTVEINAENGTTMTIIAPVAPPKRSDGSQESLVRQISQIRQVTESGPQVETLPVRNERVRHEHGAQTAPTGAARVPGVPGATDVTGAAGITGAAVNGPSVAKSPSPFDGNLSDPDMPAARSSSAGRGKFPGTAAIVRSVIGTDDDEDDDGRKRAPRRSARNIPLSTVADSLMPTPDASDAHAGIELPLTRSEVARNKRVAAAGARSADPAEGLLAEIRSALETRSGPLWSEPVEDSPEGVFISPEKFFERAKELGLTKPRIVQVINSLWQPEDRILAFKVVKSAGRNVRLIGLQRRR